ncbi:hypothetical protein LX15_002388 [Streptoalloteichus tenebrarius]|uniref:Uncharacterized protein n=1 Tax=Streptoalloteichus tenebrarius (strain ATCC 17920 / DSM 40477 / JCM 4838 / CBS 697.72 / NBRC 16177 / NCIMB 11028 / NRRL B-12390 / A12253. 1 / ISP 5477) TaxID=1933 RepID=A0ABT1HT36_STRSD|nr:Rv3235 family protein [Streptoalloteichus tenebrarius]MCP2258690.1 hypothetical protein [Streptoalloteichus tenebrarius]BFF02836.1 hypothetical protein GCM10020241_45110 [Streptoalloteichus tenebrarius]
MLRDILDDHHAAPGPGLDPGLKLAPAPELEPPPDLGGWLRRRDQGHRRPPTAPPTGVDTTRATGVDTTRATGVDSTRAPADPSGAEHTAESALRIARAVLVAVVEVADGRRGPAQLDRLLAPAAREALDDFPRPNTRTGHRLQSVRAGSPRPGVIEASGSVWCGTRVRALAARIEIDPTGPRCTELRLL